MLSSKDVALTASFAALYVIFSVIPGIPTGVPGLEIQYEAGLASIFGIILGPYLGALAAFIGTIIAWILPPGSGNPLSAPFLLNPAFNAFTVGLIYTIRQGKGFAMWKRGFAVLAVTVVVFPLLPPSQPLTEYWYVAALVIWDKLIALFMIPLTVYLTKRYGTAPEWKFYLYLFLAFIGNQADSALGCDIFAVPLIYSGLWQLTTEITRYYFVASPLIYPAIRLAQAIFAALVAVPLIKALENIGWFAESTLVISPKLSKIQKDD